MRPSVLDIAGAAVWTPLAVALWVQAALSVCKYHSPLVAITHGFFIGLASRLNQVGGF